MFTVLKNNKIKYIMTSSKLYDFFYNLALKNDIEKLEDCIEWAESYPILKSIASRVGYKVNDVGEVITLG